MKQSHDAVGTPGFGVCRRDVGALSEVTAQATQAEIALLIGPHVLLGDNMINLMWQQGGALRQATIFAGVLRTLLYPRAHGLRHRQEAIRGAQYSSVWSLSTLSSSLRRTMCSYSACSSCESVPAVLLSASSVTRPDRSFSTASKAASNFSNVCFSIPTLPPHGISIPTWTHCPCGAHRYRAAYAVFAQYGSPGVHPCT